MVFLRIEVFGELCSWVLVDETKKTVMDHLNAYVLVSLETRAVLVVVLNEGDIRLDTLDVLPISSVREDVDA